MRIIGLLAGVVVAAVVGIWAAGGAQGYLMPLGRPNGMAGEAIFPALLIIWVTATLMMTPKRKRRNDHVPRPSEGTVQ